MTIEDKVVAILTELGPMTTLDLMEEFPGMSYHHMQVTVCRMRQKKKLHVGRWIQSLGEGKKRYPRPVWHLGEGKDAKKRKDTRKEVNQRYSKRRKARRAMVNSVFNLGLSLIGKKEQDVGQDQQQS